VSCDAETVTVNRHGALIVSGIPLHCELKIEIVVRKGQRANAKVVYVDPNRPRVWNRARKTGEHLGIVVRRIDVLRIRCAEESCACHCPRHGRAPDDWIEDSREP